ncbi:hypothetical protein AB0C19_26105 [Micromonospora sp. NPDC048842]|uniref:hypothetical protein n=1 Tax=Micromonospora sp. NPDC048842 TaxID=3154346 RepID=UPI0033E06D65
MAYARMWGHPLSYPCGEVRATGVLYDYFRANDDAAAVGLMKDFEGGPFAAIRGGIAVDAVDLKGIEPTVTLGKLVSFVRQVDWDVSLVDLELLWSGDDEMLPVIEKVAALAQRARDAGEDLYCWCCL